MSLRKLYHGCFFIMALLVAAGGGSDLRSENVFLKDGRIINGSIVGDAAASITVRKSDGKKEVVPRGDILRILYTNLKMGKIHVQMRDGSNFEAFIVDEDQDTYTFRKVLQSPAEMKVNRSDILFISERNPSGLKGTPGTGSIELSWFPPYNPVKHYLVYHREKSEGDFRPAVRIRGKSNTLDNLKSNTAYVVKVTAVDHSGDESSPSNLLTVTTKNIRPTPPGDVRYEKGAPGTDGKFAATLRWNPGADPDGTVAGYAIYRVADKGKQREMKVTATEYTAPGLADRGRHYFEITSIDDRGDESEDAASITVGWNIIVEAHLNYIMPLGTFGDTLKAGRGAMLTVGTKEIFFRGFDLGITAGYWSFEGNYREIESAFIVPALLMARWRFTILNSLWAAPAARAGYGYHQIVYKKRNPSTFALDEEEKSAFEPMALGGLDIFWNPWRSLMLSAGASYGAVFEKSETMTFVEFHFGAGWVW